MNIWRRGSLMRNPYERTAFRVTRVSREMVRRRTIAQVIVQTKRMVAADETSHMIDDRPVTIEEINQAELVLFNGKQRAVEELLAHNPEGLPLKRIQELAQASMNLLCEGGTDILTAENASLVQALWVDMVRQYLDEVGTPDPSLGGLELILPPPFGPLERSQDAI